MMPWTARQRALLEEMGLRLWAPEPDAADATSRGPLQAAISTEGDAAPIRAATPNVVAAPAAAAHADHPPGERPPGVADMDWPALREAVASCTACGLCRGRTQTVFGTGHLQARWMVVGEAPGQQEDLRGEPFVGKSGQLLDSMLRALQLTRDEDAPDRQVYIANTLKCRPPGNRNPDPAELAQCEPFLVRQIELVRPALILAMGRVAVQALLRSNEPIGRLRGRVHRYRGVPLVVTYHPAYLLRNPQDKARTWDDLCLAREVYRSAVAP